MKNSNSYAEKKLKQFGLNPIDWSVKRMQKNLFRIVHKKDGNFVLKGKYEDQTWQKIWLISV